MIIIENEWKKEQEDGLESNTGRWVYQRFFGPICHFSISKYDNKAFVTPLRIEVEPTNSVCDFEIIASMAEELLDEFEEVMIFISLLKTKVKFTSKNNIKEKLIHEITNAPLIG